MMFGIKSLFFLSAAAVTVKVATSEPSKVTRTHIANGSQRLRRLGGYDKCGPGPDLGEGISTAALEFKSLQLNQNVQNQMGQEYFDPPEDNVCINTAMDEALEQVSEERCYPLYSAEASIPCCCPGLEPLEQSLRLKSDLPGLLDEKDNVCPFSLLRLTIDPEPCRLECCDTCRIYGDPRGISFLNNAQNAPAPATPSRVRSIYTVCDNRKIIKDRGPGAAQRYECTDKRDRSKSAIRRCNNMEGCSWRGDDPDYTFRSHGAPCAPDGSVDFTSVIYKDAEVEVTQYLGERGVVETLEFKFANPDDPSVQTLGLHSKVNCFDLTTSGPNTIMEMVTTSQDAEDPLRVLFASNNVDFERRVVTSASGNSADVTWKLTGKTSEGNPRGFSMVMECKGATTDKNIHPSGISTLYTTSANSKSTIPDAQTRIDASINVAAASAMSGHLEGFCFSGDWGSGVSARDLGIANNCPISETLSTEDHDFLRTFEYCENLLGDNGCDEYVRTRRRSANSKASYKYLMDMCVAEMCKRAYTDPLSGFRPPPGGSEEICINMVTDFGAQETYETYYRTFRTNQNALGDEEDCNTYQIVGKFAGFGEVVLQEGFLIDIQGGVDMTLDLSPFGTGEAPYAYPKWIEFRLKSCAEEECHSSPGWRMTGHYLTQCQELYEFALDNSVQMSNLGLMMEKFGQEEG